MTAPKRVCYECFDTLLADLFFLKLLNNPSRLYETTRAREPCPYCSPESDSLDDSSNRSR